MKFISVFEPTSKTLIDAVATQRNLTEYVSTKYTHPQEDYLLASSDTPIFVVADGVTLNFMKLSKDNTRYPNPSPAGTVASIFCHAVQKNAQDRYARFNPNDIRLVFKEANAEVAKYNDGVGHSEISGNSTGLFAATGSFAVIKDGKVYWASICDAFFAHFDKNMKLKHMSSGSCSPYAVINGEERMVEHTEQGVSDLQPDDRVLIFTDGFEHYIRNPEFLELFRNWSDDLEDRIKEFAKSLISEDFEKYGHERSLIAVSV